MSLSKTPRWSPDGLDHEAYPKDSRGHGSRRGPTAGQRAARAEDTRPVFPDASPASSQSPALSGRPSRLHSGAGKLCPWAPERQGRGPGGGLLLSPRAGHPLRDGDAGFSQVLNGAGSEGWPCPGWGPRVPEERRGWGWGLRATAAAAPVLFALGTPPADGTRAQSRPPPGRQVCGNLSTPRTCLPPRSASQRSRGRLAAGRGPAVSIPTPAAGPQRSEAQTCPPSACGPGHCSRRLPCLLLHLHLGVPGAFTHLNGKHVVLVAAASERPRLLLVRLCWHRAGTPSVGPTPGEELWFGALGHLPEGSLPLLGKNVRVPAPHRPCHVLVQAESPMGRLRDAGHGASRGQMPPMGVRGYPGV